LAQSLCRTLTDFAHVGKAFLKGAQHSSRLVKGKRSDLAKQQRGTLTPLDAKVKGPMERV